MKKCCLKGRRSHIGEILPGSIFSEGKRDRDFLKENIRALSFSRKPFTAQRAEENSPGPVRRHGKKRVLADRRGVGPTVMG